jgi:hypothetical protein
VIPQAAIQFVSDNPGWTWLTMLGTAAMSWIAPAAGIVTIGLGILQGYISWKKFKHWQKTQEADDGSGE